jgi:hypothetical protein
MNKAEIITKLKSTTGQFQTATSLNEEQLYATTNGKWSVAENMEHLILSVKPVNLALGLPKIALLAFGKANRAAMNYEEVVAYYQSKLQEGAKATKDYVPSKQRSKDKLLQDFSLKHETLINKLESWSEADLDKYFLPHPILGKLSVREILFFTIYHISHHYKTIQH